MENKSAVEWLVEELSLKSKALKIMLNAHKEIVEQAKGMEQEQKKDLVIGTYIDLKMRSNKKPYGLEVLSKLVSVGENAEKYYKQTFKQPEEG
jgi:tRNA U34 5-methylaminomethyl-2-thiouridine-forming methyltransferase MnmC